MKELVKLVVWMPELVEAELPQAHVLQRTLGGLPGLKPVGARKAHQQQDAGDETRDRPEK